MRPFHFLMALILVAIWGCNFVAIKLALRDMPPFYLAAARFLLSAFPVVFFLERPRAPLRLVALYGTFQFALQFGLLFLGIKLGMSAGLASLALQMQAFVTIALAIIFLGERVSPHQIFGAVIAFAGIALIAGNTGGEVTATGLFLVLAAAVMWAIANIVSKKIGKVAMIPLISWGSMFAIIPLVILSVLIEGPHLIVERSANLSWVGVGALCYIVYPTTLVGFSLWSWLLSRYSAGTVAPISLLVPIIGFASSAVVLGEPIQWWKVMAAILICSGLLINIFGGRIGLFQRLALATAASSQKG